MGLMSRLMARVHSLASFPAARGRPRVRRRHRTVPWGVEQLESRLLLDVTLPHGGNPVLEAEHQAVMNLVRDDAVTHRAIASGEWDQASTWDHGVPGAGANVLIPQGLTVTIDSVQRDALHTLRIDGTFQFATDVNTGLVVDTIVVTPTGTLLMGTAASPVQPDVEAKIIIADSGPIDTAWDPNLFSRGLISHGLVQMHGAAKTSFVALAAPALRGATTLTLAQAPTGWQVGDRLILTGTTPNLDRNEDEELAIVAISGTTITIDHPLLFNHRTPEEGLSVYLANVSRNVVIESQNPFQTDRRGHVMFMHRPTVDVAYAGFYGLGRTDKRNPLHNVQLDAEGRLIPGTGRNQVGRYAVHFHRTGLDHDSTPVHVVGSAVVDSPGWGFVNHSSYVVFEDNVSFNVIGAHFVTEVGNEIGAFRRNLAIRSTGSGQGVESRQSIQDFGHNGDGFWFQGAGIEVEDNVAASQRHSGFVFFTRGLDEKGLGIARFLTANLVDPSLANGQETIDVGHVPIRLFRNNTAFASGSGFESWFHLLNAPAGAQDAVEGMTVWNTLRRGIFIAYTNRLTVRNATVLGDLHTPWGTGIDRNNVSRNITYDNVRVEGFSTGLFAPLNGVSTILGGRFSNVRNITIETAMTLDRVVNINGDVQFVPLSDQALLGRTPYDIYLQSTFNMMDRDITRLFNPDVIRLGTVRYNGQQVYYFEQAADFVPFPAGQAADYIPPELVGKTNQELFASYGLAMGGIVAPANATTDPMIRGLIGDPASYLPNLRLFSAKYTSQLSGYQLSYTDASWRRYIDATPVNLREGWNLITRDIGGYRRTFLVFGDVTGPTFQLASGQSLRINPLDLTQGLVIEGQVYDNSFGFKTFRQRFTDLDRLPQHTRDDGSQYIVLSFLIRDHAGNTTAVSLEITVDASAPRQQDMGFRDLPSMSVSETLTLLIGFKEDREG
jgi:hypothetical protein